MKIKIVILFLICLAFSKIKAQTLTPAPNANLIYTNIFAERIKIGGGTTPITSSAIIEANSNNKGILLPRMTNAEMLAIANPVRGLIVYNTDNNCLYVKNTTTWVNTCANLSAIEINWNSVTNKPTTIAGYGITDYNILGDARYPQLSGSYSNPTWITAIANSKVTGLGSLALLSTIVNSNISTGANIDAAKLGTGIVSTTEFNYLDGLTGSIISTYLPLSGGTITGSLITNNVIKVGGSSTFESTYLGQSALNSITSGTQNVAIGKNSLTATTNGSWNTAVGYLTLATQTSGTKNTAVGAYALNSNTTSQYNTAIGYEAGKDNTTGFYNVFIGGFKGTGYTTRSKRIWLSDGLGNVKFVADSLGNIGIGINDPLEKLDLVGNAKLYHIVGQNNIYDSTVVSGVKKIIKGDDLGGSLLLGTSSTRLTGDILTVTFSNAYSIPPYIVISDANDNYASGLTNVVKVTTTTTGFKLTVKTGLSLETDEVYKWNYYIKQ